MKSVRSSLAKASAKAPTGITGVDEITGGGLPRGRTTLLVGGPGSGKTVLALQILVHGAQFLREPGIFVAFEETSDRIVANAESFGWKLTELQRVKSLQTQLAAKQVEKALLTRTTESRERVLSQGTPGCESCAGPMRRSQGRK